MKSMSEKVTYQQNFGFRKTNMMTATETWNTKTENKKLYAVTLYIECELEFLNLFLCVLFSILSIEYHVNYFKSPYFSVPLKFHVTFVYLCHVFFKIFSLHLTCLGIVAKNLSVIIMSDHKNIKKEKPIVRLNEIIRIIVQMQCSMIDVHILLAIKWPNSSKKHLNKFDYLDIAQLDKMVL